MEARAIGDADLFEADLVARERSDTRPLFGDRVPATRPARTRHRRHLGLEIAAVLGAVLAVAGLLRVPFAWAVVIVAMALIVNYHAGRETVRPGLPHIGRIMRDTAIPIALVAVGVSVGLLDRELLTDSLLIGAASGVGIAAGFARRLVNGQVRLVVVGDQMAIASAATRWANEPRVKVVGALVLEPEVTQLLASPEAFGVQSINGIDEVDSWVSTWDADMVVVSPGPSMTSDQVRQLSWHLEGTGASLAVLGVLDAVSPHRIDSTHFAGVTLIHVRSSRQSGFIRAVKHLGDRVVGAALLVLVSPLLATMTLAVRLDSRGRAVFTQTRVGVNGVPFTMYKMRTMRTDADEIKAELAAMDDGNGMLFKMRQDPRTTRVGRLLRKTSLDELPQLINVVKGEMSLIGPRPALPEEVAQYNAKERRRLAVRPGITGLWQVSGRSDLDWDTSVDLDLRYTDNWRLSDDVVIGFRTVDAVLRSKGAY
jgi:exopolysaccharide biosynthesis polyprenyl glycosylphosphotransferase